MKKIFILSLVWLVAGCALVDKVVHKTPQRVRPIPHRASRAVFGAMPPVPGTATFGAPTPVVITNNVPTPNVTLAWDQSSDPDVVVGYSLYYGVASRVYTNVINCPGLTHTNVTIGPLAYSVKYYFAATCYDTNGLESDYSAEAHYTIFPMLTNYFLTIQPQAASSLTGASTNYGPAFTLTNAPGYPPLPDQMYWRLSITKTNY